MNNENLYKSNVDLVAHAIAKAAAQEKATEKVEELCLKVLAHAERNFVGEIDAVAKKQIALELYSLIEAHLQEVNRDC